MQAHWPRTRYLCVQLWLNARMRLGRKTDLLVDIISGETQCIRVCTQWSTKEKQYDGVVNGGFYFLEQNNEGKFPVTSVWLGGRGGFAETRLGVCQKYFTAVKPDIVQEQGYLLSQYLSQHSTTLHFRKKYLCHENGIKVSFAYPIESNLHQSRRRMRLLPWNQ